MIRALLSERRENNSVKCYLCPHYCNLSPGKTGICGVRKNIDGELYSLNSDKIIAANTDPIEKKPLYHFLPGSSSFSIAAAGCNFHCSFCQNHSISIVKKGEDIVGDNIQPEELVKIAEEHNCDSIAYTYTEPTIFFELMKDTADKAKKKGIRNVMITNGFISSEALEVITPYIDAANIDIKSFSDSFYRKHCGGRLAPVLDTVKRMIDSGIWVELTTLLIPGLNTDKEELDKLMEFILNLNPDIPWHVSRFFPNYEVSYIAPTNIDLIEKTLQTAENRGLKYLYGGNFSSEKWEQTYCPSCRSVLIKREGYHISLKNLSKGKCGNCGVDIPGVWI